MKKLFILLALIILQTNINHAQNGMQMGDSAYASLLTCGPGTDLYEVFGHTALRFCDSSNNIDFVFNYGSFDDFENGFYLKFAKGQLDYCLVVQYYEEFLFEYMYFGRAVWEQRLEMSRDELRRLFNALILNAQPENMYYAYDFFRDNCATRVTDIIDNNLADRHIRQQSHSTGRITYRNLVHRYTHHEKPWCETGIDLLLGARCDRPVTDRQQMFAPIEMMNQYDTLRLSDGNRLAQDAIRVLPDQREPNRKGITPTLFFALLLLAVVVLSVLGQAKGWKLLWLDAILFGVAGLTSLLLLFLWLGSDHWCSKWNMNVLWANPLFLILLCRLRKPVRGVTLASLCCILLVLLIWLVGWPQHFSTPLMLIALTLGTRLFFKLKIRRQ